MTKQTKRKIQEAALGTILISAQAMAVIITYNLIIDFISAL